MPGVAVRGRGTVTDRETIFEGGVIAEEGVVTATWLLDVHGILAPGSVHVGTSVLTMGGRIDGRPVAWSDHVHDGIATPPDRMSAFLEAYAAMRSREHRIYNRAFVEFLLNHEARASLGARVGRPLPPGIVERCARAEALGRGRGLAVRLRDDVRAAVAATAPFMGTLDPFALAMVCPGMEDGDYAAMDATFDPAAPLAGLICRMPGLAMTAADLWRLYGAAAFPFRRQQLDDALTWVLSENKGPATPGRVSAVRALAARFAGLPDADRRMSMRRCRNSDPPKALFDAIEALPRSWEPRTGKEWEGMMRCEPAIRYALHAAGPDHAAAMIGGKGRWPELADGLSRSSGMQGGKLDIGPARDMAEAFAHQVLRPACPDALPVSARMAAQSLLFSGRGVRRILEMTRDWHGRRAAMLAALPPLPARPDGAEWGAGFPDWSHDGVEVTVLRSGRALVDEGASGLDGQGDEGLSHCVGGYASRCRRGESRILGLRIVAGGSIHRLSTAEVRLSPAYVVRQHRGMRNAAPPAEATAALEAYMSAIIGGTLPVNAEALGPMPVVEKALDDAGYDFRVPGALRSAFDMWAPLLPRRMRHAGVEGLRATVEGMPDRGAHWWVPPGGAAAG